MILPHILYSCEQEGSKQINALDIVSTVIQSGGIIISVALLYLAVKNLSLIAKQMHSNATYNITSAHKSLFLPILSNKELLQLLGEGSGKKYQSAMLATLLINHCAQIFMDYELGILPSNQRKGFVLDAKDMFNLDLVNERWQFVREFHPTAFQKFIFSEVYEMPSNTSNSTTSH
ncbi:MAG: hypothetical protein JKY19_00185 [Alcanivoracaceae bacterium]|nr:hypothetical protein [Alcanivoracaceae bacterium]